MRGADNVGEQLAKRPGRRRALLIGAGSGAIGLAVALVSLPL